MHSAAEPRPQPVMAGLTTEQARAVITDTSLALVDAALAQAGTAQAGTAQAGTESDSPN